MLPSGITLKGKSYNYTIQKVLGQGSFGITYLASVQMRGELGSLDSSVLVAIKEFFMRGVCGREESTVTSGSKDGLYSDYKRKFIREATSLSHLHHPNIVKVLEAFEANNTAYYVMEYIGGGSLDDYITNLKHLGEDEAIAYTSQIGSALSFMHSKRMLHLDVKPGNIMRRTDGTLVLIDFGLSKLYDENGVPESSTKIGGGTPGYAPLEQSSYHEGGGFPVTMDVYALGATLFKMLTGHRPPEASDILNEGFPANELQELGISDATISSIAKAMAPIKKNRFQQVSDFLLALQGEQDVQVDDDAIDTTEMDLVLEDEQEPVRKIAPLRTPANQSMKRKNRPAWGKWGLLAVTPIVASLIFMIGKVISEHGSSERTAIINSKTNSDKTESEDNETRTFTVNGVSFTMTFVKGGTFQMGATIEQENDAADDEKPVHSVTLSSYYISQTEVTQALWKAIMNNNPSYFKGDKLPVETVSWNDCQTFIKKLNKQTGQTFRLPTEAEWEYAARGGNKSRGHKYAGSNTIDYVAWYESNSGSSTHIVATKQPNELGLYDMSGNVWEWCQDWYGNYSSSFQTNPTGASAGSSHVYRGGGWDSYTRNNRSSSRGDNDFADCNLEIGFRLALDAQKAGEHTRRPTIINETTSESKNTIEKESVQQQRKKQEPLQQEDSVYAMTQNIINNLKAMKYCNSTDFKVACKKQGKTKITTANQVRELNKLTNNKYKDSLYTIESVLRGKDVGYVHQKEKGANYTPTPDAMSIIEELIRKFEKMQRQINAE